MAWSPSPTPVCRGTPGAVHSKGGQPNYSVSPLRPYRICSPRPTKPLVVQARIGFEWTPPGNYQHAVVASAVFLTDPKADFRLFQQ